MGATTAPRPSAEGGTAPHPLGHPAPTEDVAGASPVPIGTASLVLVLVGQTAFGDHEVEVLGRVASHEDPLQSLSTASLPTGGEATPYASIPPMVAPDAAFGEPSEGRKYGVVLFLHHETVDRSRS